MHRPLRNAAVALGVVLLIAAAGLSGAADAKKGLGRARTLPTIAKESAVGTVGGKAIDRYTLTNSHGMVVKILTYGGIIQEVWVPDQRRHLANVTLGFATADDYVTSGNPPYFGALI